MSNDDVIQGFDEEKSDSLKLRLQRIENLDGGLIVHAAGTIDTYNSLRFQRAVEKAIDNGFTRIVFELGAVNYMSSAGIGCFPHFLKIVRRQHGDMVLSHVQPTVYEVFSLLGLSQFLVFKDGLYESLAHFSKDQAAAFPTVFTCPICSKRLRASKAGRFRCRECKTVLVVDETARAALG